MHVPVGPLCDYKSCVFQLASAQLSVLIEDVYCAERAGAGPIVFNDKQAYGE